MSSLTPIFITTPPQAAANIAVRTDKPAHTAVCVQYIVLQQPQKATATKIEGLSNIVFDEMNGCLANFYEPKQRPWTILETSAGGGPRGFPRVQTAKREGKVMLKSVLALSGSPNSTTKCLVLQKHQHMQRRRKQSRVEH